jgi:hypothetical protein
MIRSFADKMKDKREAYKAKQKVLAEQAEQRRLLEEERIWEQEQLAEQEKLNAILNEDKYEKEQEYLIWKQEQKILQEQLEQMPTEKINTGVGIGHESTWILTWKSFSTHPDIINLPMSEKIRLFKIAELQHRDRLNYYANLHVDYWRGNQVVKGAYYWSDGIVDADDQVGLILENTIWDNSVDVNTPIIIPNGVTLKVLGVLTVNVSITINEGGTLHVEGLIVKEENVTNNGTLIVDG